METPLNLLPTDPTTSSLVNDILTEINDTSQLQRDNVFLTNSASQKKLNHDIFDRHIISTSDTIHSISPTNEIERQLLQQQNFDDYDDEYDDDNKVNEVMVNEDSVNKVRDTNPEIATDTASFLSSWNLSDEFTLEKIIGSVKTLLLFALIYYFLDTYLSSQFAQFLPSEIYVRLSLAVIGGIVFAISSRFL